MNILTSIIALALIALLPPFAAAADANGQYGVRGASLASCAMYEKERAARSEIYRMIASWMDGYITGINQSAADTYDIASFESTELLAALVSEHCKKYPETTVFAAVHAFTGQFAANRLRAPSKKVEVSVGDNSVLLYEEVIRRVQEELVEIGLYDGEIDGTYNSHTQQAMRTYQESIEFRPTGFPDQLTLWRLLTSKASERWENKPTPK